MVKEKDAYGHDAKETTKTGSDLPRGDGTISDEGFNVITDDGSDKPTGQDHSTENREKQMPDEGVGAIQDESDTGSDIANIKE